MEYLEMEGKTIDEAIEKVCKLMDVSKDDLNIEVIDDGTKEQSQFGARKARIKAMIKKGGVSSSPKIKLSEDVEKAKEILTKILNYSNFLSKVDAKEDEESIYLTIEDDKTDLLIGKNGETIEALQYLVNKIFNKSQTKKRVIVDIGNYRNQKNESLIALAKRTSKKVKACGRPISITPMNPHDRRIIHITLEKDKDVRTESFGEGLYKKVVVFPVNNKSSNNKSSHKSSVKSRRTIL